MELVGPDGIVGVHEVGGRAAVAEYAPRLIGLTLEEGRCTAEEPRKRFVITRSKFAKSSMKNTARLLRPCAIPREKQPGHLQCYEQHRRRQERNQPKRDRQCAGSRSAGAYDIGEARQSSHDFADRPHLASEHQHNGYCH
jgi:hypothetical protein